MVVSITKVEMSWCEGVSETRLLIAPDVNVNGNGDGRLLSLRHPKTGNSCCYRFVNGSLQEIHWIKSAYKSWFIGDYVCEDGCMYAATPVDPVFIFLPIFEEARMKKLEDPGKFRQLDEIIFVNGYPGYQQLLSIAEKSMQILCETKEIGSMKFYRLDDTKVLKWLYYKVLQIKQTLSSLDKNFAAQTELDTCAGAVSILAEYLKDEPWLKTLCNLLKVNLPDATAEAQDMKTFTTSMESSIVSSNPIKCPQGKRACERGKSGKQAKNAKVETGSKNIKDMFLRSSARKKPETK